MRDITFKSLAVAAMLGSTMMLSLPMEATIVNDYKDARRIVLSGQGEKLPITLAITPDTNGGSLYNYSGTDDNGDTFHFWINTPFTSQEEILDEDGNPTGKTKTVVDNSKIILKGISTTAQYTTIPDEIIISDGTEAYKLPVENVCFEHGGYNYTPESGYSYWVDNGYSFENAPSLGRIFLSANVKNIRWGGNFNVKDSNKAPRDYHFISENVPVVSEIGSQIRIYVPNSLRETYVEGIKNQVTTTVWSEEYAPVTVNVASPGTLASSISDYVDNLETVNWLIVTGTPNSDDCRLFRRMPYLEELDLSAVTGLEEMAGCNNLQYLRKVTLPEGLKTIGKAAFEECTALEEINLPEGITEIKENGFYNSTSLKSIDFPESLRALRDYAFQSTYLSSLDLKNVEEIGYCCFQNNQLKEIHFGNHLKSIGAHAFYASNNLERVILPEGLTSLSSYVFYYCHSLKEISIPSTLTYFDTSSLRELPSLESLTVKMLFPCYGDVPFKDLNDNCVLYVPALTINEYMTSDVFRNFRFIKPIEEDLTELTIRDREYHLVSDKGLAEKVDVAVKDFGHLTISRNQALPVGNYSQSDWAYIPTLIVESEVTADAVELSKFLQTNRWHFLTFPFDINVKDIVVDEDALWVVRKYNGENRAAMDDSMATWENMADNDVLKAGEGYIFHCAKENGSYVNFTFRPAENGNAYFAKDDVVKELAEYPSEFPHNASWNLVGNTFPAYLNLKAIDFDGPVTIYTNKDESWNWRYEAYSPLDDDLVIAPFQAFFVQKQDVETGAKLTLKPEGRAHSEEACQELYAENEENLTRASSERALFNIHLKGEKGSDRTRLVINEEASPAYESNRDASKFMAMDADAPQIYILNNGVAMAIDEQPLGEGSFEVGTRLAKGTYTISLSTKRAENYQLFLLDKKTGKETNLSGSDYLFDTDGNDSNRFIVSVRKGLIQSDVEEVNAAETTISAVGNCLVVKCPVATEINVYAADGHTVVSTTSANLSQKLPAGLYVVKAGEKVAKLALGN